MATGPTITGTLSGQRTSSEAPINPFFGVAIGDPNAGAADTLTITLSNGGAGGTLADGTGYSGLVAVGGGVYALSGAASVITGELDALNFTPTPGQPNAKTTTTFTLSDASSAYTPATLDTIVSFAGSNGDNPDGGFISDTNGNLFGTAGGGGTHGYGTVFEIPKTSSGYGDVLTLWSFNQSDGRGTSAALITDGDGNLFGASYYGGAYQNGTVFEIPKTSYGYGSLQTLWSFNYPDGANPTSLVINSAGDLFGTTAFGGDVSGSGSVFEIPKTPSGYGQAKTVLNFNAGFTGGEPEAGLLSDANGDLFGTTYDYGPLAEGVPGQGTVFEIPKTSTGYGAVQILAFFYGFNGAHPLAGLISDGDGNLFGTTAQGGATNDGTVFEIPKTPIGYGAVLTLLTFDGSNGGDPQARLTFNAAGDLYGTTVTGGDYGYGTVFEIPKTSSGYGTGQAILSFNGSDGAYPRTGLINDGDGNLLGTTHEGGTNNEGTVFKIPATRTPIPTVDSITTVTNVDPPVAPIVSGTVAGQTTSEAPLGPFSGVTIGDANFGAIDTLTITLSNKGAGGTLADGTGFSRLVSNVAGIYTLSGTASAITNELNALVFTPTTGQLNPATTTTFTLSDVSSAYGAKTYSSTPTLLASFGPNGGHPQDRLTFDAAGNLFGTTSDGGDYGYGTVFEIPKTSSGYDQVLTLVSFNRLDGRPLAGLTMDGAGDLFGTTFDGGSVDYQIGTVFEIAKTASGWASLQTVVSFDYVNGEHPYGDLIIDGAGNLFGTTNGGSDTLGTHYGTVFGIPKTSSGYDSAQTLVAFNKSDGAYPQAGLISDSSGDLFGTTTYGGGPNDDGVVFEIPKVASGYDSLRILTTFDGSNGDGAHPRAGLIIDANDNLFGTTQDGGSFLKGTVFEIPKTSSGYGPAQVLLSFNGSNGADPEAGLIIDGDGNLFGTARGGGASNRGIAFEIPKTSSGYGPAQTVLSFDGSNGSNPSAGLLSDSDGDLFGTTASGGPNNDGVVFEIADVFTPIPTVDSTTTVTNSNQVTTTESVITDSAVTTGTDGKSYVNNANFNGGSTTLTGTAEAADTVTVSINNGAGRAATVAADGNWSFTLLGLANGQSYSAVATATGPAGGIATSPIYAFTVDTTTSESPISDNAVTTGTDGQSYINAAHFNSGSTTLMGATEAGDTVTVSVNGGAAQAATVASDGSWSFIPSNLTDGENVSAVATAIDPAGNSASSAAYTFTVDTTAPAPPVMHNLANPTNASYDAGFAVNAGATVTVTVNGTALTAAQLAADFATTTNGGADTYTAQANDFTGTETVAVSTMLTDAAGNVSSTRTLALKPIDTTAPPQPVITTVSYAGSGSTAHWNLSGSAAPGTPVTLYDSAVKLGTTTTKPTGAWTFATSESNGEIRDYSVTAIDAAGNTSAASAPYYEGTPNNDIFNFPSEATLSAAALINGNGGNSDAILMSSAMSLTDADFAHIKSIEILGLTGASSVTLGANSRSAGIGSVVTGTGNTLVTDSNAGTLAINAASLDSASTLTLTGPTVETVTNLTGNLSATGDSGALNVTAIGTTAQSVATGSAKTSITDNTEGSSLTVDAAALGSKTLTLSGTALVAVNNLAGNVAAGALGGALSVAAVGSGVQTVTSGTGATSITNNKTSGSLTVKATALTTPNVLTLTGAGATTVTNGSAAMTIVNNATGAVSITATALGASGAALTLAGAGQTTVTAASGAVTIDAGGLGSALTVKGAGAEVVKNLLVNLAAGALGGALNATTGDTAALTIATGSGSSSINASAMRAGETLTLTGAHAATVSVGGNLAAAGDTGALTVTAMGLTPHTMQTGGGADSISATIGGDAIQGGGGGDSIMVLGHSAGDTFVYAATTDSRNTTAGHDTITGFAANGSLSDLLDFSRLGNPNLTVQGPVASGSKIAANTIAWVNLGATDAVVYVNDSGTALASTSTNASLMQVALSGITGNLSASNFLLHA